MTVNQAAVIVVGVDGSPQSLSAVDWAAREAAARQCRLRIMHAFLWPLMGVPLEPPVMGPPDAGLQQEAEQLLRTATDRARQIAPALDISTDLPVCAPAAALIDASRDAALLVVGHRGLGGFTGLLVGSVGVQTAAHAACPVVVVRDSPSGAPERRARLPVRWWSAWTARTVSNLAVDFAFAYAARHRLGVVAVHAYSGGSGATTRITCTKDLTGCSPKPLPDTVRSIPMFRYSRRWFRVSPPMSWSPNPRVPP